MKKILLILVIILNWHTTSFSQECSIADDLYIKFEENDSKERIMKDQKDFWYSITQTNRSPLVKKVYSKLIWSDVDSRFANYYWKLYKKQDTGYIEVPSPQISSDLYQIQSTLHMEYGEKGDSIFNVYDIEKLSLPPFKSDTLCFNLLKDTHTLDSGEYRFKIYFRVGNVYSVKNRRREITRMYYVSSDWYYFRLPKKTVYSGSVKDSLRLKAYSF